MGDLRRGRWRDIEKILDRALELSGDARTAFMAEACGRDGGLRAEVEALLLADAESHPLLDSSLGEIAGPLFRGLAAERLREAPVELPAGTRLGSYELLGMLGAGGMGEVYRARDARLERQVAVKVLRHELAADEERLRRFAGEARAASALNHPNIVTVHDIGEERDARYIVMELVEGRTLRRLLESGPVPAGELLRLAAQMARGLAKAHAAGIVHRDLKPENVMVSADGFVKIVDFGLSKLTPAAPAEAPASALLRDGTRTRGLLGTLAYMSPEQAAGRPVDFRSDQFSLGAILHEMATGRGAFRRATPAETLSAIREGKPEPPLGADLPRGFRALVERCLAKAVEDRFASTVDLARDLGSLARYPYGPAKAAEPIARRAGSRAGRPAIESLAVLPLVDPGGDPRQEYFADGMTEALIADLARVGGLRVISRTSIMRFKGTRESISEIARRLGVEGVLEGSVLRVGSRVRITARLVHGPSETHIWEGSYERELGDVLVIQGELTQAIAREIRVRLSSVEQSRLAGPGRIPPEAHESYMLGRYLLNRRSTEALEKSVRHFERAIRRAPGYAPAHSGLADALALLAGAGHPVSTARLAERARAAATKALELDERLAEAHLSLAFLRFKVDWDWAGAEAEFRHAVELGPGNAGVRHWFALYLSAMSRHEQAAEQIAEAQKLDPLSLIIRVAASRVLQFGRDFGRAVARCREALELDPGYAEAHFNLGMCRLQQGRRREAVEALEESVGLGGRRPLFLGMLGAAYARSERETEARRLLAELRRMDGSGHPASAALVLLHVGLGELDRAVERVERAIQRREGSVVFSGVEPMVDDLRADPRFARQLRGIGLWRETSG